MYSIIVKGLLFTNTLQITKLLSRRIYKLLSTQTSTMRATIYILFTLLLVSTAAAVQGPFNANGKEYYVVTADDPTEDSGLEVCAKVGKTCVGYTNADSTVCKQVHPNAADLTSASGDASGTYCDGSPQTGVCANNADTCLTCPTCTTGIQCQDAIGNLYKEAYVECTGNAACPATLFARNTDDFLNEISLLNSKLQNCQMSLPASIGKLVSGNTQLEILRKSSVERVTILISNNQITGIQKGVNSCKNKIVVTETDLDSVLGAKDRATAFLSLYVNKKVKIQGCTFLRQAFFTLSSPFTRFFVKRQLPPPPTPTQVNANCGGHGEQCNNRACATGICASPREFKNGRWQANNFRCIGQSEYDSYCKASGNSRAAWDCLTSVKCTK